MRYFIKKVILFGIVLLVSFPIFVFIVSTSPVLEGNLIAQSGCFGFTYKRIPDYTDFISKKNLGEKAIILGTSTAYQGISPDILNTNEVSFFNLASSRQVLPISKNLIKSIDLESNVKFILVDIYPELLNTSTVESTRDLIVNNPDLMQFNILKLALESKDLSNVLLYSYFLVSRELFGKDIFIKEKSTTDCSNNFEYAKGYAGALFPAFEGEIKVQESQTIDFEKNMDFQEIEQWCKTNNIGLIYIISPELGKRDITLKNQNTIVINGNLANLPKESFYDDHHLNKEGSIKYTNWLKEQLISFNVLAD